MWYLILSIPDLCLLTYFKNAFDSVSHQRLVKALEGCGIKLVIVEGAYVDFFSNRDSK